MCRSIGRRVFRKKCMKNKQNATKKQFHLSMVARNNFEAYTLLIPFLMGAVFFFAYPIFLLCRLSLSSLSNIVGLKMEFVGFSNFRNVIIGDVTFLPALWSTLKDALIKIPLTIVFSLLIGMLVNQKIVGRGFFRTVYFLPFLLGTGYVMQQLISQDVSGQALVACTEVFLSPEILGYLGDSFASLVTSFFSIITTVLWGCSVQILLFLSGLQGISVSYYEAARVESANEWDCFWHITLPMISPIILLCIIYSLVDTFNSINNPVLDYIKKQSFDKLRFDYASAMSIVYALILLSLIGVVFLCMYRAINITKTKRRLRR